MFLSNITYPFLNSVINFCLKICFQQVPNFGMSRGQRYRYQRSWTLIFKVKDALQSACILAQALVMFGFSHIFSRAQSVQQKQFVHV